MQKDARISVLLDIYGGILSEIQFKSTDLYYNQDLSLSEISYHTGKSRQGVYDSIKRAECILNKMEDSLGIFEKLQSLSGGLAGSCDLATEIEVSDELSKIKIKAKKIKQIAKNLNSKIEGW